METQLCADSLGGKPPSNEPQSESVGCGAALTLTLTQPYLQNWFVGATWDIEVRGDPTSFDITYEIELAIAERSRGEITAYHRGSASARPSNSRRVSRNGARQHSPGFTQRRPARLTPAKACFSLARIIDFE